MAQGVDGVGLAALSAGVVLVYAGLKGKTVLSVVQSIAGGHNPADTASVNDVGTAAESAGVKVEHNVAPGPGPSGNLGAGTSSPDTSGGSSSGGKIGTNSNGGGLAASIASDVQQYIGTGYHLGGAPAQGRWDCSSLVNKVIGMDLGQAIPTYAAGTYHGKDHGPTAAMWLAWTGATTVGHSPGDAQPGDLLCWATHCGIAIGGGEMVSARNPSANPPTGKEQIRASNAPGPMSVRRLKAVTG